MKPCLFGRIREVLAQLGVSDFGKALVFCILFLIYLEFLR
jgi:hypothetical protein